MNSEGHTNKPKLTVGIIAKNEERLLPFCLKSIQPIADEIIVVDTGSSDRTVQIARKFGAKTFFHRWNNNFAKARNVYVKAATNSWILSIDADETVALSDLPKIIKLIKNNSTSGYFLKDRVYTSLLGTAMGWHPLDGKYPQEEKRSKAGGFLGVRGLRLFRKEKNVFYDERVHGHENISDSILKAGGEIKNADITIHDYGCLKGNTYARKKQRMYFRMDMDELPTRRLKEYQLRNLAVGYLQRKAPDKALSLLRRALRRGGQSVPFYYLSAAAYWEKASFAKAISCLKNIFKIKRNHSDALWMMGVCLDELGRSKEGLVYLLRALKQVPNHALYLNSLGVVYYQLDRFGEARKAFEKSIAMLPSYRQPAINLSRLKRLRVN